MPDKEEYFNPKVPSQSNRHWLPWLQKQLILNNILAQTPEFPDPYKPDYSKWRSVFERFPVDEKTLLVGYSCGGGFLVRWLSENKVKVGRVVLVAPWIDPNRTDTTDFFDFIIDASLVGRAKGITILVSDNDYEDVQGSVKQITDIITGIKVTSFKDKGHFSIGDLKTVQFPELLDVCIK